MLELAVIVQQLVYGVLLGGVYALIAVGLTLIFGIMELPNFAHGDFYMLASFFTYSLFYWLRLNFVASIFISMFVIFLLGVGIRNTLFRDLARMSTTGMMILAFGLSMSFQGFALMVWGADYVKLPALVEASVSIGPVVLDLQRVLAFTVALVAIVGLWLFIQKTKTGRAMRATQQDRSVAQTVGINTNRIYSLALGIGLALVSLAGSILTPIYFMYPAMGGTITLKSFSIVIFGGMGSVKGAIICSFIIAMIESLTAAFISFEFKDLAAFFVMMLVISLKPSGLFGQG